MRGRLLVVVMLVSLVVVPNAEIVGAHQDKAGSNDVIYGGEVYSSEEFRVLLDDLEAQGISLHGLTLPNGTSLMFDTEEDLEAAYQQHYGHVPADLWDPPTESPRGKRMRARQAARASRASDSGEVTAMNHLCVGIHNDTGRFWGHDHCGGTYLALFGNDGLADLRPYGFNDVISSIQVGGNLAYSRGWTGLSYIGTDQIFPGNMDGTDKYYSGLGKWWNDEFTSIKTSW